MLRRVLLAFLMAVLSLPAGIISVQPPSTTVQVGQNFTLNVGVDAITDLYAFQFDVIFNPALLSAVTVTEGALFSGVGVFFSPGFIDNTAGMISFIADSLSGPGPGVAGPGGLASVQFTALAAGTSSVDLANIILLDSNLGDIVVTTARAGVTVVPEPSTGGLVVAALGAMGLAGGWVRRRGRG